MRISQVRQAISSVNPNLPVAGARTMQEVYAQSLQRQSFTLVMLAIAAAMALALGIVGIYGVISYSVSQRTREIGIRMALGAQKGGVKWMFVRSALALTGIGIGVGIVTAAVLVQFMKTLLFGIHPIDPAAFIGVPVVLVTAAMVASYLPAARATALNAVDALKAQ